MADKITTANDLVECPRCGGDGGDRYLCGLCKGQGKVTREVAKESRKNESNYR